MDSHQNLGLDVRSSWVTASYKSSTALETPLFNSGVSFLTCIKMAMNFT